MIKRILSVFLTVLLVAGLVMVPGMSVSADEFETVDIADYEPGDKPTSVVKNWYASDNGILGFDVVNDPWYTYVVSAPAALNEAESPKHKSAQDQPALGWTMRFPNGTFVGGKTYLMSYKVTNKSDTVDTKVVSAIVDAGGGINANNTIGVHDLAAGETKTITRAITLLDSDAETIRDGYSNSRVKIGLGFGNTTYISNTDLALIPNSSIGIRIDDANFYLAEQVAWDIENTLSATKVLPGSTVTGSAKVVNQLGEIGTLDQSMTYKVVNGEKKDVTNEVIETKTEDGDGTYTLKLNDNAPEGIYTVLAISSKYHLDNTENFFQAPATLEIKSEDYSDTADLAVEESLVSGAGTDTRLTGFGVTYANTTGSIYSITAKGPQASVPGAIDQPAGGMVWPLTDMGIAQNDKYILTFKVKKNNTDTVIPNLVYGIVDGSSGGSAANYGWKAQTVYTMDVTSSEWQTVVTEVNIPYNQTKNTRLVLGLGVGCTESPRYNGKTAFEFRDGASILIDVDTLCLVKDGVKGIVNEAISSTNVYAGGKLEAKAAVVNSANLTTGIDQTIEHIVLDAATRQKPATGMTIAKGENGNYTVNVSKSAAAGDYVVVATNSTNGSVMRKGLEFTVDTIDRFTTDYVPNPEAKPENLVIGEIGNGTGDGVTVAGAEAADNKWEIAASERTTAAPSAYDRPAAGLTFPVTGGTEKDTSYILTVKVRSRNPEVPANLVWGLIDHSMGGATASYQWKGQYMYGEEITSSEWQTLSKVITPEYKSTANLKIHVGLGIGNTFYDGREYFEYRPGAILDLDHEAVTIAEEAAYDIDVTAQSSAVRAGGTLAVNAAILNQVGMEGVSLNQNFEWVALNSNKTDVVDGITVTPNASDSSVATVSVGENVAEGTYVIAAYNAEYDMAKSMVITVSNEVSVENIALDSANNKVTFDALNVPNDNFDVKVYIAEYTEAGKKLVQAKAVPVTLSEGNNIGAVALYENVFNTDNLIKIFVWKSDLTPLAEEVEVKKN